MHGVSRRWERLNVEIQHCDNSGEPIIGKLWSKGRREGWVGKLLRPWDVRSDFFLDRW